EGRVARRRRPERRAPAAPADPHDVVRVHLRPDAALERARRGRRGATADRDGHHHRHAVLDRHRDLPRPRALRRRRARVSALAAACRGPPESAGCGARAGARQRMMRSARAAVAAVVLFAGCAPTAEPRGLLGRLWRLEVGPQYRRPPVETPEDFRGRIGPAEAASFADLPWWQVFGDSTLQDLVRRALADNYDLQSAVARIEEARAQVGVAASDLYPHDGYQGPAARRHNPCTPTVHSTHSTNA